jgi:hypothetical protein
VIQYSPFFPDTIVRCVKQHAIRAVRRNGLETSQRLLEVLRGFRLSGRHFLLVARFHGLGLTIVLVSQVAPIFFKFPLLIGVDPAAMVVHRARSLEGIAKAKLAGVYKGRLPSIDPDEVRKLKADGFGPRLESGISSLC